jgi:hypothetical protein
MVQQIRLKFPEMIKQKTVRIPDTFHPFTSLPTLLQHGSLFIAHHAIVRGTQSWSKGRGGVRFREIVSILVSFGPVHLDIVTLNVENNTQFPTRIADLDQIENLNTTLHVAFNPEH